MRYQRAIHNIILIIVCVILLTASSVKHGDEIFQIRLLTRDVEFNYFNWMVNALSIKINQSTLGLTKYIPQNQHSTFVLFFLEKVDRINNLEEQLLLLFSDPSIDNSRIKIKEVQAELSNLYREQVFLTPVIEAIFQDQLASIVKQQDLSLLDQTIPPILYHSSPVPTALIVSPREIIRQDANISLSTEMTLDQQILMESKIEEIFDMSALVVEIGGIGLYPTMVMYTSDINWLAEVVAHEWTHNFLSLRPLGLNYLTSPELRTMNETTATIAGKEFGARLIEQFYPNKIPPEPTTLQISPSDTISEPPLFNFQTEMHKTRIQVDQLLNEGKILQAEKFMEQRRLDFIQNGYLIRKLNQAYFAFYGAYADEPVGAAGEDPVGEAVRTLRQKSVTLANFINRISLMWSYEQLLKEISELD